MLGAFVASCLSSMCHFVNGIDSHVDILKQRVFLSVSDPVQPLIGKPS
ncbi:phage DNA packaging protein C [Burkholderia pseudomallei]